MILPPINLSQYKTSIAYNGPKLWNMLPAEIKIQKPFLISRNLINFTLRTNLNHGFTEHYITDIMNQI